MERFLLSTTIVAGAELLAGTALVLLPRFGSRGRRAADALARAPLLDVVWAAATVLPWLVAGLVAGWPALFGAILGQVVAVYLWIAGHELVHYRAARGPRIVRFHHRLVGTLPNQVSLWLTAVALLPLWSIRLLEVAAYPVLVKLLNFPRYDHGEWINLSRHKFQDLVGHDLLWCLYCDWMTSVWALGSEMLRNVESFWCPIQFPNRAKNQRARTEFPDAATHWVPADGSMEQVVDLLERKYQGGRRTWFGHPDRADEPPEPAAVAATQAIEQEAEPAEEQAEAEALCQELLTDHAQHPRHMRDMPGATHEAEAETPMCDDRVHVFVRVDGGRIEDVSFIGKLCPIAAASASLMTEHVRGGSVEEAASLARQFREMMVRGEPTDADEAELGELTLLTGIHRFPSRVKCATLPWHALLAALERESKNEGAGAS
ncbi:MAG: Fe-S cluster assembly sulfur transfer protein SufU [Phycisphaeraceae bacterium]